MPFTSLLGGDNAAVLNAFSRSQAIISFKPDGTILEANENFCKVVGYRREEIIGKHHRIFVEPNESGSPEYTAFWKRLNAGEFDQRQYKRITKSGDEIWIEASYNPVIRGGKVVKIVKIATDVTAAPLAVVTADRGLQSRLPQGSWGVSPRLFRDIVDAQQTWPGPHPGPK